MGAAEELKKEQERKAEERLRVIAERCGTKAEFDTASIDELKKICQTYFDKWYGLEGEMFFLQREVILRDLQINELTISVSGMKGKFIKPTLKKVSKYENKFAKLQEKAAKFAFANQLKQSKLILHLPPLPIPRNNVWSGQSTIAVRYCTVLCITVLYSIGSTALCCTAQYSTAQYSNAQYNTAQYMECCLTDSCPYRLYSVSLLTIV